MDTTVTRERDPYLVMLGSRIRYVLDLKGVTMTELASHLGYTSSSMISQLCNGDKSIPSEKLIKLADYLKIPPFILLSPSNVPEEIIKAHIAISNLPKDHWKIKMLNDDSR